MKSSLRTDPKPVYASQAESSRASEDKSMLDPNRFEIREVDSSEIPNLQAKAKTSFFSKGDLESQIILGYYYFRKLNKFSDLNYNRLNYYTSLDWFDKAAKHGNAQAKAMAIFMSLLFDESRRDPRSELEKEGTLLSTKLCADIYNKSAYFYGDAYGHDINKAYDLYMKALTLKDKSQYFYTSKNHIIGEIHYSLGVICMDPSAKEYDITIAIEHFARSYILGADRARFGIPVGSLQSSQIDTTAECIKLTERFAKLILQNRHDELGIEYLRACEAHAKLMRISYKKSSPCKNVFKHLNLAIQSSSEVNPEVYYQLYRIYRFGLAGVQFNLDEAGSNLLKASKSKNLSGEIYYSLYSVHKNGGFEFKKDPVLAAKYLDEALQRNNPEAQFEKAILLKQTQPIEAIEWFKKSGLPQAQKEIHEMEFQQAFAATSMQSPMQSAARSQRINQMMGLEEKSQWMISKNVKPYCENSLRTFQGGPDFIEVLPDHRIIGAFSNGRVVVWDKTGSNSREIMSKENGGRQITSFTLAEDIGIGYSTGDLIVLRVQENFKQVSASRGCQSRVTAITLANARFVTGHADGSIQPWDGLTHNLQCSKPIKTLLPLQNGYIASDTDMLLSLWNVKSDHEIILNSEYSDVPAVLLYNGRIARATKNKINIWDPANKTLVKTLEHANKVEMFIELPDGRIASNADRIIYIWNVETGACQITLTGLDLVARAMLYLPNGWIYASHRANTPYHKQLFWNINDGKIEIETTAPIWGKKVLADGRILCEGGDIYQIGLSPLTASSRQIASPHKILTKLAAPSTQNNEKWRIEEKVDPQSRKILSAHDSDITASVVISDTLIASAAKDGNIKIWNLTTGKCIKTLEGHQGGVISLYLLSGGKLASTSRDNAIKIWNPNTGKCEGTLIGHEKPVLTLIELDDGRVVSGSEDKSTRVWNVSTGEQKAIHVGNGPVRCLRVLSSEYFVSTSSPQVMLWNSKSEKCAKIIDIDEKISSIVTCIILPNRKLAAAHGSHIKIWNLDSGKCEETLVDPDSTKEIIHLSAFSDEQILSYSVDGAIGTISLWNLTNNQKTKILSSKINSLVVPLVLQDGLMAVVSGPCINIWDIGLRLGLSSDPASSQLVSSRSSSSLVRQNVIPRKESNVAWQSSFEVNYDDIKFGTKPTDKLGEGGFGVVIAGNWLFNDVAIKKIKKLNPSLMDIEEFKKECQILSASPSNYIVRFFGCCFVPSCCIVMERMEKGSLRDVLRNENNLTWKQRYKFMYDIARGVAYLHARGLIHQDIKSHNILMDKHYQCKVGDLGLARLTKSNDQGVAGTLQWMAPELFKPNAKSTKKSDIYSMGFTFWETASGEIPLSETKGDRTDIIAHVTQGKREAIPNRTPPKIRDLIRLCWNQDPVKRPDAEKIVTVLADMASDFEGNESQEPISGPQYRSFD